jgi:hypothetical protein
MTEMDVHKCLCSYGVFPMTKVLKKLEKEERFEDCNFILKSMISYREKYHLIKDDIPTKWSREFEDLYFSYFEKVDETAKLIAKGNLMYHICDIEKRLGIIEIEDDTCCND